MIAKRIFAGIIIIACFVANSFGMNNPINNKNDSIPVTQFYEVKNTDNQHEFRFKAEEQSIQTHDGQQVFSNKRTVEYRISKTNSKIIIKRHEISSKPSILCKDKKVQELYPDVTTKLLSSILTPHKIKKDTQSKIPVSNSLSDNKSERVLIIDKLALHPVKDESFMGVTLRFNNFTEELVYPANDSYYLDLLKAIHSQVTIDLIDKDEVKHQIQLSEKITPIL